jgi:hypothetical protein
MFGAGLRRQRQTVTLPNQEAIHFWIILEGAF